MPDEQRERTDDIDPLKDLFVKLEKRLYDSEGHLLGNQPHFYIPFGIKNHYDIRNGDGLLCEIVELYNGERKERVKKDILVDISFIFGGLGGVFSKGTIDKYNLSRYRHAHLYIKKAIKQNKS
ncbi:hypothetical protein HYW75_03785 [Candidatus Pacearchaeota archaeon]|nr:hypothetical protein [Candidatus Pacearchaeota archaeon]